MSDTIKEWPITSGETGIWLRLKGLCLKLGIARYGYNGPRATRQREPGWRKEGDLAGPISPEAIETRLYLNSTAQPRDMGSWGYIPRNRLLVLHLKIIFKAKNRTF